MKSVTPHKIIVLLLFTATVSFCVTPRSFASDTLTDAISLHQKGVSDDVLIAWAAQQPAVTDTADNRAKLKDASISQPVVDALMIGNSRPKTAAAAAKSGVPINDETVIGPRAPAVPAVPPAPPAPPVPPVPPNPPVPPVEAAGYAGTVAIDGWNVYNYDPFHTAVVGWPYVQNIYPWYAPREFHGYTYGRDYFNNEGFRWQNQIPPNRPAQTLNPPTQTPHWPQNPNRANDVTHQPTTVRTPPPGIVTHETSTGVKYVTQEPQRQAPQYYVPPANTAPQPVQSAPAASTPSAPVYAPPPPYHR